MNDFQPLWSLLREALGSERTRKGIGTGASAN